MRLTNVRKVYASSGGDDSHRSIVAVDDVSFAVAPGDRLGIIGPNGAGKSTLLQMIAGLNEPTSGSLEVQGQVTAIMTLGVGLRDHVSGRENIYLDGELQGKSRAEIDPVLDDVIAFSELGDFIDQPVRTYSTGMKARLAFSMLVHINPEILIVDEALSVGDAAFSRKATAKIREICSRGKIVIIVSHSIGSIREMCNRCLWLERGRIVMDGPPSEVGERYVESVRQAHTQEALARFTQRAGTRSFSEGWRVDVALCQGEAAGCRLVESGAPLRIQVEGAAPPGAAADVAVTIVRLDGTRMFARTFAAPEFIDTSGALSLAVMMEPLVLGAAIYRADVALNRRGVPAAEASTMFEVYAPLPPTGGKPMLLYPVDIEVIGPL